MARAAKVLDDAGPAGEPVTEMITYVPGPLDPVTVRWSGHVFQANVPKEITGHADGNEREQLNHQLITSARDNKHFTVGDAKPKRERAALPKTATEYRAWIVGWLKDDPEIEHADQLIARFAKERDLRMACEVGSDDYAWLATLFMPKLHQLARGDDLTAPQVATLWINHGFNETPW